ncbi:rRNA maturation RNase YbeY [Mycoplasmopsis caviae]|uniref:Endoribonuclease YbeY n=1 Tax=Mycoplasmopsis caviae TaxID=55603 RepID=A0A3P8LAM9_9BACT|nr:rRNA maturation RNase YbeY [Mycoplasmopsis caviae]UUD35339.1 rRNA maturation RNase YbeY [Mycoplasmopsis caviae]VDR41881.1 conserved hypothetical metalloprotease [Mycoplasmopsis caviae]
MVELNIINKTEVKFLYEKEYKQILENLTKNFDIKQTVSVDVLITNNAEIQELNKKYRGKDYPTDILSFGLEDWELFKNMPIFPLGELIISHEKVESQAIEFGHSLRREYCYLFAHGLIHLMGYDHEHEEERIEMNKLVDLIFKPLNISREE